MLTQKVSRTLLKYYNEEVVSGLNELKYQAFEYTKEDSFVQRNFVLKQNEVEEWVLFADNNPRESLGMGLIPLDVVACGICSTDLSRRFLPFPLPQIIGHEVLARDGKNRRVAVGINASHYARGDAHKCDYCGQGLDRHCPKRMVLGIDRLPGGFGSKILAPVNSILEIPDSITDKTAILIEPFAAALHAVESISPKKGDKIAVLGPKKLGLLVIAALNIYKSSKNIDLEIIALPRRKELLSLAKECGANEAHVIEDQGKFIKDEQYDVVIDTTGNPQAFFLALRIAKREVHIKSTHGQSVFRD